MFYCNIPINTCDTVVWVCSVPWCAKGHYRTCTRQTCDLKPAGFPIPVTIPIAATVIVAAAAIFAATAFPLLACPHASLHSPSPALAHARSAVFACTWPLPPRQSCSFAFIHARLGSLLVWLLPVVGCIHLPLFMLICPCLCLFGVICTCPASHLCLYQIYG